MDLNSEHIDYFKTNFNYEPYLDLMDDEYTGIKRNFTKLRISSH